MVNQLPFQPLRQTCGNFAAATPILAGNRDGMHCSDSFLIFIHSFTSVGFNSCRYAPGRTNSSGNREVSSTRSATLPTQGCGPLYPCVVMAIEIGRASCRERV